MGAINVGFVLRSWSHLPARARLVLIAMAHSASDDERSNGGKPRRYFGGPGYLAEVMYGPSVVEQGSDGRLTITSASARRQVEKVLTELVRAGAVARVTTGGRRHRSEYEVVLTPPSNSPTGKVGQKEAPEVHADDLSPTKKVGVSPTVSVGTARPFRSVQPDQKGRPQEKKRMKGGIGEEEDHPPAPQDRVREDAGTDPDPSRQPTSTTPTAPLSPTQMGEYETCSAALRARLGELQAVEAAMKYSDEHGCTITDAVIALAKVPA